jgi:chaperonin GroEL
LKNAGYEERDMYPINMEIGKVGEVGTKPWFGYNIKTNAIVDMKEAGIIDPHKVTRQALSNASSIAGTILLTECTIVDKPEDKKEGGFDPSMLAGMM